MGVTLEHDSRAVAAAISRRRDLCHYLSGVAMDRCHFSGLCGRAVFLHGTAGAAADRSFDRRTLPACVFAPAHLAWLWGPSAVSASCYAGTDGDVIPGCGEVPTFPALYSCHVWCVATDLCPVRRYRYTRLAAPASRFSAGLRMCSALLLCSASLPDPQRGVIA